MLCPAFRPRGSVVPFDIDADPTFRIGPNVAFHRDVRSHLDLDIDAAGLLIEPLLDPDIDTVRDISPAADRRVAGPTDTDIQAASRT